MNLNSFPDSRAFPDSISAFLKAASPELRVWHYILDAFGDDIWKFPVFTYVCRNAKFSDNGEIRMTKKAKHNCVYLMQNVARYLYAKGFGGDTIKGNSIEKEMLYATTQVCRWGRYEPEIKITRKFKEKLNAPIPEEFRKGLCALVEFATHWAIIEDFAKREAELKNPVLETAVVSHVLSPKWQCVNTETIEDYTWTPERVEQAMDTIGNLVLIEKSVHTDRGNILYSQEYKVPAMNEKYQYSIFRETQAWADSHEEYGTPSPWGFESYVDLQQLRIRGLVSYFETGIFMVHQS